MMIVVHFVFNGVYVHGQSNRTNKKQPQTPNELVPLKRIIVIMLIMYFLTQAIYYRTFGNYILAFTVNYLGWSKTQGANITSAFHGAATVARGMMILSVRFLSIKTLVFGGLIFCNISALGLVLFLEKHDAAVWCFMLLLSAASVIPHAAMLAWIDYHIGLRGFVSIIFSLASNAGEIISSPLIGFFFEKVSYMAFIYYTLGGTVTCVILMILLILLIN